MEKDEIQKGGEIAATGKFEFNESAPLTFTTFVNDEGGELVRVTEPIKIGKLDWTYIPPDGNDKLLIDNWCAEDMLDWSNGKV